MSNQERLTYYNGIMWRAAMSEGRTRTAQPMRWDGSSALACVGQLPSG
jgi:hypothetical protein